MRVRPVHFQHNNGWVAPGVRWYHHSLSHLVSAGLEVSDWRPQWQPLVVQSMSYWSRQDPEDGQARTCHAASTGRPERVVRLQLAVQNMLRGFNSPGFLVQESGSPDRWQGPSAGLELLPITVHRGAKVGCQHGAFDK